MATLQSADTAQSIAAEILRFAARQYPDVDAPTAWQALVMAAADLRAIARARALENRRYESAPPFAS